MARPGAEKEETDKPDEPDEALELVEPVEELEDEESAEEAEVERCGRAAAGFRWRPPCPPLRSPTAPVDAAPLLIEPLAGSLSSPPLPSEPEPEPEPDSPSDPSPSAPMTGSSCLISPALKTTNPASELEPPLPPMPPTRPSSRLTAPLLSTSPAPWH